MSVDDLDRAAWIAADRPRACPPGASWYPDADAFLLSADPFGHPAVVIDSGQSGLPVEDLVRAVRARTPVPVVVVLDGPGLPTLVSALDAGADAVLPRAVDAAQVAAVLRAAGRRTATVPESRPWRVHTGEAALTTPGGRRVRLSDAEHAVMLDFADAPSGTLSRERLAADLWGDDAGRGTDNAVHAAVYRLRRRVEEESGERVPLRSIARVGYTFDAPLRRDDG